MKLYIYAKEKKRFADIFTFLARENSKVYISPAGIDFKHNRGNGSISKEAFVDFEVSGTKRITILDNKVVFKNWIKNWKEIDAKNGRTELIELSF